MSNWYFKFGSKCQIGLVYIADFSIEILCSTSMNLGNINSKAHTFNHVFKSM